MSTTYEFRETEPQVKLTNLLEEVLAAFEKHNLNPMKVLWAGTSGGELQTSWDEFCKHAANINYDNGYSRSGENINSGLVIRFPDGMLVREVDTSEGWHPDEWEWTVFPRADIKYLMTGQTVINMVLDPVVQCQGPLEGYEVKKRPVKVAGMPVPRIRPNTPRRA